jgi:hypothetical protein
MKKHSLAILIYGEPGSTRNAFTEEKYKMLASCLVMQGFAVDSVLYHDSVAGRLETGLAKYNAILVWVNPVEQGHDRKILDAMLTKLAAQGCFISAHPDVILKMGTKKILYDVRKTEFGGDVKLYASFEDFKECFLQAGEATGIRILKQYRGNGGNGVFKIDTADFNKNSIAVTHATAGDKEELMSTVEFFEAFEIYFQNNGMLIDQAWNANIINGMVRCYLCGAKVAGFGYQEINALYPKINGVYKKPGRRFNYSEECGLFRDLREIMENRWVPQLQQITGIETGMLPVIWDADFFINNINTDKAAGKYSLCEINASSVSPFPESAIPYIAAEVEHRLTLHS